MCFMLILKMHSTLSQLMSYIRSIPVSLSHCVSNFFYPPFSFTMINLSVFKNFQVFSAFGVVQKIAIFEKNGGTQALIQYPGTGFSY